MAEDQKSKPLKSFRAGVVSAAVWKNESKEGKAYPTISFERGYQDKDENWKSTTTMRQGDLGNLQLVLAEAQRYCAFEFGKEE